jgi:hypothetical protein
MIPQLDAVKTGNVELSVNTIAVNTDVANEEPQVRTVCFHYELISAACCGFPICAADSLLMPMTGTKAQAGSESCHQTLPEL